MEPSVLSGQERGVAIWHHDAARAQVTLEAMRVEEAFIVGERAEQGRPRPWRVGEAVGLDREQRFGVALCRPQCLAAADERLDLRRPAGIERVASLEQRHCAGDQRDHERDRDGGEPPSKPAFVPSSGDDLGVAGLMTAVDELAFELGDLAAVDVDRLDSRLQPSAR